MPTAIYDRREAAGEGQPSNPLSSSEEVATPLAIAAPRWRDLLFSLSLANLCFLLVWQVVIALAADEQTQYFEMTPPSFGFVVSLFMDIGMLGAVIYLLVRRRHILSMVCVAVLCVFVLLEVEQLAEQYVPGFSIALRLLAVALTGLALCSARRTKTAVKALVLVVSPLLPILMLNACWLYSRPELQHLQTEHVAGKLPSTFPGNRVIWIIFDEMDYHLAFEVRPQRLQMPEFDRLRGVSLFADHAQPPAGHTILSLPSLLVGKRVVAERHRTNDISLRFEGSPQWRDFSSEQDIFRRLRASGFNGAVAGWHHPYCRLIGSDLSECVNAPNGTDSVVFYDALAPWSFWARTVGIAVWNAESLTVARMFFSNITSYLAFHAHAHTRAPQAVRSSSRPLAGFANVRNRAVREQLISATRLISGNAIRMAADPDLNLVFIHAPAPHPPGIWNSTARQFTATERSDYIDNLGLADSLLGRIRRTLEQSGQWDRTTVLISADHPFRIGVWQPSSLWTPELAKLTQGKQSPYIPFLLKLPGQTAPWPYHRDFNTVVSGDLIWEILTGNISQPEQAAHWLDTH
jgi:hypothetical protein